MIESFRGTPGKGGLKYPALWVPENTYHVVNLSGGKDSTAMTLLMIEAGMPIDAAICADTGMEFPEMYDHLEKMDDLLWRERGLHITYLRHPQGFEWMLLNWPVEAGKSAEYRTAQNIPLRGKG